MFSFLHAIFIYALLLSVLFSVLASDVHCAALSHRAHRRSLNSTSVALLPTSPTSKSIFLEPIAPLVSNSAPTDNAGASPSQFSPPPNVTTGPPKPGPATLDDFQIIAERRIVNIINVLGNGSNIAQWSVSLYVNNKSRMLKSLHRLSTLGPNGKWPDSEINYTTGCDAQRANWPAQVHWQRIGRNILLLNEGRKCSYFVFEKSSCLQPGTVGFLGQNNMPKSLR